jgi:hypothetical protein
MIKRFDIYEPLNIFFCRGEYQKVIPHTVIYCPPDEKYEYYPAEPRTINLKTKK